MGLIQRFMLGLAEGAKEQLAKEMGQAAKGGTEAAGREVDRLPDRTEGAFSKMSASAGKWMKGIGATIAAAFTIRAVVDFSKELFKLGSAAEETASKFQTTFGASAAAGAEFLAEFANKAGLSTERGQDFLATIGAMVQGMGATREASLPMSEAILKLAGDLQSFHNVPIEETFRSLRSGLVGEYEPLRRFGIVLTAVDVQQKALVQTGKTHVDSLTALEKSQAALTLAYEKAGPALGDLDRTQDSTANTLRRMNGEWIDFKTFLGQAIVEGIAGTNAFNELGESVGGLSGWVKENREEIVRWATGIGNFVAEGIRVIGGLASNTARELTAIVGAFTWFWNGIQADWAKVEIRFAQAGQQIMHILLMVERALLQVALRIPGLSGMASKIQQEIFRVEGTISELGTFIGRRTVEMQGYLAGPGEALGESTEAGAEAAETAIMGATVATEAGAGKMTAAHTKAAKGSKIAWDEEFFRKFEYSLDGMVNKANEATKDITSDLKDALDQQNRDAAKADDDRLKAIKDFVGTANQARDVARFNDLQLELAHLNQQVKAGTLSEDAKRAAFLRTTEIHAELAAIQARQTLEASDAAAASREGAEQRIREAYIASGMTAEEVNAAMAEGAKDSSESTEASWLKSMDVINGALSNLNGVFGGVFGGLLDWMGQVSSGTTALSGAFTAWSQVSQGGILGIVQKVGVLAGGLGGVLSLIGAIGPALDLAGDIIGGIGDVLGISGSKDPGRLRSNQRAYEIATSTGGQGMMTDDSGKSLGITALEFLLQKSPKSKGGQGGWATTKAQEDAWRLYQNALRGLGMTAPAGGATSVTAAPAPSGSTNTQTAGNTSPWGGASVGSFQHGGWVRRSGMGRLHADELVLPPRLASDLALLVAGRPVLTPGGTSTADNRQLHVEVNLYGVEDREVPMRVVEAVQQHLGQGYQREAALQGNALLPD